MKHYIKNPILYVLFTLAPLLATYGQVAPIVEKSFTVQPGGELTIDTQHGSVRLQHSNDHTVTVVATQNLQPDITIDAEKWMAKHSLTVEQKGNHVTAIATCGKMPSLAGGHSPTWPPVYSDFVVSLPASWSVNIITGSGNVEVCDLSGSAVVQTSRGHVKLGNIKGQVTVVTRNGSIVAQSLGGPAVLKTRAGNIQAQGVNHSLQAAVAGTGDIRVGFTGTPASNCELTVDQGALMVNVPKDAAFKLDAQCRYGKVRVAEHLAPTINKGGQGKARMLATVGDGTALIKLKSTDNDILVAAE